MDSHKLKALAHYIAARCRDESHALTRTQLHEVLWLADGQTYVQLGRAILDEQYVRQQDGPAPVHLDAALGALEHEGAVSISSIPSRSDVDAELRAHGEPNIEFFGEDEKRIVDEIILTVVLGRSGRPSGVSGRETLELRDAGEGAYGFNDVSARGWAVAAIGERIPYQQQLVAQSLPLTAEDETWIGSERERLRSTE